MRGASDNLAEAGPLRKRGGRVEVRSRRVSACPLKFFRGGLVPSWGMTAGDTALVKPTTIRAARSREGRGGKPGARLKTKQQRKSHFQQALALMS
jgi:hypothetical protein